VRVVPSTQLTLQLQPGLLQRYRTLRECLHHSVMNDSRGIKAVAADCDLSVSELTRRLSPSDGDPRSCDVNLLEPIMASTNDLTPLYWLNARFLQCPDTKRAQAVEQLSAMLPQIAQLLVDAQSSPAKVKGRGGR
jgi:hypothetical protein